MATASAVRPRLGQDDERGGRLRRIAQESGMIPALIVVIVVGALLSDTFLTATNFENVVRIAAVIGLLAIGQTLVILAGGGGIDLSVGAVMAASGVIGALYQDGGLLAFIFVAVLTGGLFGFVNGLGVTTAGIQPFIVTLATLSIAKGIAFDLSNATPIALNTSGLSWFATGSIGPIPVPIAIFGIAVIIGQLVLARTVWGRELYSVGGNEEAAYFSGIKVKRYRLAVYVISGLLAGCAAVLATARLNTADPTFGTGYELQAIAAVVVGGATLAGGRGTIVGTAVGVLIIALISNLLNLMNVNPFLQDMITGLIVIVVVAFNRQKAAEDSKNIVMRGLPLYGALAVAAIVIFGFVR
jgi:ribose/xylose/arabinose/galactoside ABC-type transport system permease subunit